MPFGPYKNFDDCVRKVSHKKNPPKDPKAYCAWIQKKIEGEDPVFFEIFTKYKEWGVDLRATVFSYYRFETMFLPIMSDELMTREKAQSALKGKQVWQKDDDAIVLDDHRWSHMWANTIKSGNKLFLSRQQLRRLHDLIVDELARRGLSSGTEHKTPMNVAAYELGTDLEAFLKNREAFMLDPEFISVVGSSVTGSEPADLDLLLKTSRKEYAEGLMDLLPETADLVFEEQGAQGPYIPAFELWAVPVKSPKPQEAKYTIHPMSPIPPATPSKSLNDPRELTQDSYYVFAPKGDRLMVHRKEAELIAFNKRMDEVRLPDRVVEALLSIEKPKTFILDGFLGAGVYYMIDLPWWGESEHTRQSAEQRRRFLERIPQSKALQRAPSLFFSNRKDAIEFLSNEAGPFYLVPGTTGYPSDGNSDWAVYSNEDVAKQNISISLGGTELLLGKMKSTFEVDVLIVGAGSVGDDYFIYAGAVGPVKPPKDAGIEKTPINLKNYAPYVEYEGKIYTILGNTLQSEVKAEIGDVLRVSVDEIHKLDELAYNWFEPKVIGAAENPDTADVVETIRQATLKKKKDLSWGVVNGELKIMGNAPSEAYLVNARYGVHSPLACCRAPWMAVPDVKNLNWIYLKNDAQVYERLKELGVEEIIGTKTERELLHKMVSNNLTFRIASGIELISDLQTKPMKLDSIPSKLELNLVELRAFYNAIRPQFRANAMKLGCGSIVPLKLTKFSTSPYLAYSRNQRWAMQFHVKGLSVHADFRATVSPKHAIHWSLNLGKTLLKPMLRRTPEELRGNLDLSLSSKELSEKLEKTRKGRVLKKALTKKADELKLDELKPMLLELWDEMNLESVLAQRKNPTSTDWLGYEYEATPKGVIGDQSELEGKLVIMDQGEIEFGAQKNHYHEYFIKGKKLGRRRMILRRTPTKESWGTKEKFAWISSFSEYNAIPHTLSSKAKEWMPPKGVSALPRNIEIQIPDNMRYWRAANPQSVRDRLIKSIESKQFTLKLGAPLRFSLRRVNDKHQLIILDENESFDVLDFDANPIDGGLIGIKKGKPDLGRELDFGSVIILSETNNRIKLKLGGSHLKGEYIFVKESPTTNTWIFQKTELPQRLVQMGYEGQKIIRCGTDDVEVLEQDGLLLIRGPAIKPGEVIPMDGKPTYFTSEGINKFWPSMARQPVVVLHGELKGDVVGFVHKNWYDVKTGWGWAEAVIWHPLAMELILSGKLAAFSIEVLPETIWDAEHQHDHVIGGHCVGLSIVPKGACPTCTPIDARIGTVQDLDGKVYKFGMTMKQYLIEQYYKMRKSTTEIAKTEGIPRSTLENWMTRLGLNRRTLKEARYLRKVKELSGGRVMVTALGTGQPLEMGDDPQCAEANEGGKSRRNLPATLLSVGNEHLLINAPKGILGMLATKYAKPRYVIVENMETAADLHQLRSVKPTVFATSDQWAYLRSNYKDFTGEDAKFEDLYNFERRVLPMDAKFQAGSYVIEAVDLAGPLGFKIDIGGKTLLHASNVAVIPEIDALQGVDLYIGDGSDLKHIGKQLAATERANIPKVFFTKIGHLGLTHDDLNIELQQLAPNSEALFDGAEVALGGDSPVAYYSDEVAHGILEGEVEVVLRDKPYSEYSKQTIMFGTTEHVLGLYVEGYPEEMSREDASQLKHGLELVELKKLPEQVWVYTPRVLQRFDPGREISEKVDAVGPYIHDANLSLPAPVIE
jgi:hypothetical protein